MKCKKCGSENLKLRNNGPHQELYCGDCLTFQQFLGKKQAELFRSLQLEKAVKSNVPPTHL